MSPRTKFGIFSKTFFLRRESGLSLERIFYVECSCVSSGRKSRAENEF